MIGQMQDLLDLSNVFIAKLKERQDDNNITIDRIGDLMMEHLQSMEPAYTAYCQNNARVSELIAAKSKSSPHFVQVLAEGKASSKNMDIHSFRLLPLQRLTRFALALAFPGLITPPQPSPSSPSSPSCTDTRFCYKRLTSAQPQSMWTRS